MGMLLLTSFLETMVAVFGFFAAVCLIVAFLAIIGLCIREK